jgi:hypothetical protein
MQIGEESMSNQSSENTRKQPRIFPKLFIADASKAFVKYLHTHNYDYPINYISSREDLIELIDKYSAYSDYNVPVIISDISFLHFSMEKEMICVDFTGGEKLSCK